MPDIKPIDRTKIDPSVKGGICSMWNSMRLESERIKADEAKTKESK